MRNIEEINHLIEKVAKGDRDEQERAFEELSEGYDVYTLCEEIVTLREEIERLKTDVVLGIHDELKAINDRGRVEEQKSQEDL